MASKLGRHARKNRSAGITGFDRTEYEEAKIAPSGQVSKVNDGKSDGELVKCSEGCGNYLVALPGMSPGACTRCKQKKSNVPSAFQL